MWWSGLMHLDQDSGPTLTNAVLNLPIFIKHAEFLDQQSLVMSDNTNCNNTMLVSPLRSKLPSQTLSSWWQCCRHEQLRTYTYIHTYTVHKTNAALTIASHKECGKTEEIEKYQLQQMGSTRNISPRRS